MKLKPWHTGGLPELNIAMLCITADVLGPGRRLVIWVQGCRKSCIGCISPEWARLVNAHLIGPERLSEKILATDVSDITISGGEPMLQAAGLADMVQRLRRHRDFSVICFTGFTLEELHQQPPGPGIKEFLTHIDLLIDSPYQVELNDNRGLRGSSNQKLIALTDRYTDLIHKMETQERKVEIQIIPGGAVLVGVPPSGVSATFADTIQRINEGSLPWCDTHRWKP